MFGALLKKGIKEKYKSTIMQAIGLVAISLGITWIVNNVTQSKVPLLFIISLVIGGVIGEVLGLEMPFFNLIKNIINLHQFL